MILGRCSPARFARGKTFCRQWVARGLVVLGAACLTAACTEPADDEYQRIRYACWGTPEQERAARALADAFEEKHPNIKVDVTVMGYSQYFNKIQAMMVGSVAPDVFMIGVNYYDEWASRGVLMDVTGEMAALEEMGEIMPAPRKAVTRAGRVYALPLAVMGNVTYANLEALEKAGIPVPGEEEWTWDYVEELAPRLSGRRGDEAAPTDYAVSLPHPVVFFRQRGITLFDDPYHPTRVTVNRPEAREAVRFIRRFHEKGYTVPPEVGADEGYSQLFRDGRVAFTFASFMSSALFRDQTDFEWDVLPFPAGELSSESMLGLSCLAVWKHTRNEEAARKFVRFAASPEGTRINMRELRTLPIFREIAYGEEFLAMRPPESMSRFSDTMEEGQAAPLLYAPGIHEIHRIVTNRISQAVAYPDVPEQEIIDGLEADLDRWLDRMRNRGLF